MSCIGEGGKERKRSRFPVNFWHRKTFKGKRGDLSHFSVEKFSSHGAEKLCRGTLVFQKCSGVEFFRYNGVDKILSKFLGLTVPRIFVGGTIQCFRNIQAWKHLMQEEEISLFSVAIFFSHSAEKFGEGNHSTFQKYSVIEKFFA